MAKPTFHTPSLDHPLSRLCRNRQGIVSRTNYGHKKSWHSHCDWRRPEGSRCGFCPYDPWLTLSVWEALVWKQEVKEYINANQVKGQTIFLPCARLRWYIVPRFTIISGFPSDNIQLYEIYNLKAQIAARTHPTIIETHRFLLSLWNNSSSAADVDLSTSISYFDRLRIRTPGDKSFILGPHINNGSIERWEDPGFRKVWGKILEGGNRGGKLPNYTTLKTGSINCHVFCILLSGNTITYQSQWRKELFEIVQAAIKIKLFEGGSRGEDGRITSGKWDTRQQQTGYVVDYSYQYKNKWKGGNREDNGEAMSVVTIRSIT